MRTRRTLSSSFTNSQAHLLRVSIFISFAILIIVPLLTVSSASLSPRSPGNSGNLAATSSFGTAAIKQQLNLARTSSSFEAIAFMPQGGTENISIFQSDCFTPSQSFQLGDTICAKIQGSPISGTRVRRRLVVSNPAGYAVAEVDVTTDPQDFTFMLPSTATSTFGAVVVDNRGAWNAFSVDTSDGSIRAAAWFSVSDPAESVSDLAVTKFVSGPSEAAAGSTITFTVFVTNYGPNTASAVSLTDDVPENATFVEQFQDEGPVFNCVNPTPSETGTSTCTTASLAKDEMAVLRFVYQIDGGTAAGTEIKNTAAVTGTTVERNTTDNTSSASVVVSTTPEPETCVLTCRTDMVVTANTTQGANPGAFVTFTATDVINGNCGAITANPASGSFFAVGTHTVNVSSELNSGSCTFTINVLGTPAPTITCPPDQTATAASGETTANVDPGTPTTTPSSGVTVTGERSDQQLLTDPYPIGVTGLRWTVKDADGRTASCEQRITVHANDRQAVSISCPSNKTFAAEGCAGRTLTAGEIGTPTTNPSDSHVTVVGKRSDGLQLSSDPFPIGTTQITWTATDDTNDTSASCVQSITITGGSDNTAPVVDPPDDINATTSSCSLVIDDLGAVTATDDCTPPESLVITRSGVPAGNNYPTGTTVITYTATDANGNTGTATQQVTVLESPAVPPTVTAPADVSRNTGPGATTCAVVVTDAELGTATANDNCPGVQVVRTGVPAGNVFPVGSTTVTYTATDASGNTAQDTQTVTVTDNTVPIVTPPGPVTLFTGPGATSCGVTVANLDTTLGTGSATDNCPGVGAVTRSGVPPGNVFPVGDTVVTYSATDAHGNTDSETQTVTVVDNTVPVISCPANIVLEPSCPTGAVATYSTPTATDNCSVQSVDRTAGLASGSVFPIGTTTVTHQATDIHGNQASCSFTVTVLTPQAVINNLQASVSASSLTGQQKNGLLAKLSSALQGLNNGQTNVACNKLNEFNTSVQNLVNHGDVTPAQGADWISSSNHVRNAIGCTSLPCT